MPSDTPSRLAVQAAGDPQAFIALYDLYFQRVYNYFCTRCADPCLADDLTAQIFQRLLEKIFQYDPRRGPFEPWLFGIARNLVNGYFRRQRFTWLPLEALKHAPASGPALEEQAALADERAELLRALARLDERSRDLLSLKYYAGLAGGEIAALTGLSEGNVRVSLHRALQRLRAILEEGSHFTDPALSQEIVDERS